MALDQSALLELLGELKLTDTTDRIRAATERRNQELIDAETAAFIGAAPYERTAERTTTRNGSRPRTLSTTAGDLELRIPKLRQGSLFPSLLERRRRVDQALFAVVMEAYLHGRRVVLGFDVGDSETEQFWKQFLRSLRTRGLDGVKLVISDAHAGLKKASATVLQGAAWQRCRVHFMRNVLTALPKGRQEMVASVIRTIFAQPDAEHIDNQFDEVMRMIERVHPKTAELLADAREDILAFKAFPSRHWRQMWSTNPLERLNREVKRRTDVVGVFPNNAALLRLAGAVLVEQHDEWEAGDRRYFSEASMTELTATIVTIDEAVILPSITAA